MKDLTEDPELQLVDGMEGEIEGFFISLAEPSPRLFTFQVNGEAVSTTLTTEYRGGSSVNLVNDVKVEGMIASYKAPSKLALLSV